MFVMSTVHGFTAGADNRNLAAQWVALTGGLLVFLLVTFRLLAPRRRTQAAVPSVSAPSPEVQPSEAAFRGRSAERADEPSRL